MIKASENTQKFIKLIDCDVEIKSLLQSTTNLFTVFVPVGDAFEGFNSEGFTKDHIHYHITPVLLPTSRIENETMVGVHTLLDTPHLNVPQRLTLKVTTRGFIINHQTRIITANISASNGVIHALDKLLHPPLSAIAIIHSLPNLLTTFLAALSKTGLDKDWEACKGKTIFAPTNQAFEKLGPIINNFISSAEGNSYLEALLSYHVSLNTTLYSNNFYTGTYTIKTWVMKLSKTLMLKQRSLFPKDSDNLIFQPKLKADELELKSRDMVGRFQSKSMVKPL